MNTIAQKEYIPWPSGEIAENFAFYCSTSAGSIRLHFKWITDKWCLWVTLPSGEVRQAGVIPGVESWAGFNDYGIVFEYSAEKIEYMELFNAEMYFLTWE